MSQGRSIEGKPMELIDRALKVDPTHWKALAMAGTAAFDRKDYQKAVAYWEKCCSAPSRIRILPRTVAANIDEARQLAGMKPRATLLQILHR